MKRQPHAHEESAKGAAKSDPPTTISEMDAFKSLTKKLLKVDPAELDAERKKYEKAKKPRA